MKVFYKVEGTIWYGDSEAEVQSLQACLWECFGIPSDIFFREKKSTQKFGIQFSFYKKKKEEYGFAEEFISLLQSGMTLESGEFYIANPYTGRKRVFIVRGGVICVKACY